MSHSSESHGTYDLNDTPAPAKPDYGVGTWRARDGRKAVVEYIVPLEGYCFEGRIVEGNNYLDASWTRDGCYLRSAVIDDRDLVGPWIESEKVDAKPEPVKAWAAFAVVDINGALREACTSRWFAEEYVRQHGGVYRVIPATITPDGE